MNHKNQRIAKLWNSGMRSLTLIGRKCGLPDTPAGRDRVRLGLETAEARGELQPPLGPDPIFVPESDAVLASLFGETI